MNAGWRSLCLMALPTALLVWFCWPLISGAETLYLRDVLNTHLGMKWAGAEALRAGELPWLDPWRGGQPLLGNLNAAPLYPDSLLFGWLPLFWMLNAHFWLHWLLAPVAMFWLGRSWGLSSRSSWVAAVAYATCGYFFSNLSFYNLIAGVALTPALAASSIELTDPVKRRPSRFLLCGVLWALLLLAGDPLLAAQAGLLSGLALAILRRPPKQLLRWGLALSAGTLIALPQLVEFVRILGDSYRGAQGFSAASATIASFDPRQIIDWFIPLAFGRPDRLGSGSFWGAAYHTGQMAYYFTLYPGILALALVAASGRRLKAAHLFGWLSVGLGLFMALGRFNPLVSWIYGLEVGSLIRYPVKFWLLIAVGSSLLCGLGFDRLLAGAGRRSVARTLLGLGVLFAVSWVAFSLLPGVGRGWLTELMPAGTREQTLVSEQTRWSGLLLISTLLCGVYWVLLRACGEGERDSRRVSILVAGMVCLHVVSQLFFLHATVATDELAPYREASPVLTTIDPSEQVVHGSFKKLFGASTLGQGNYADGRSFWLERRAFADLYPFAGAIHGRQYDLVGSPEGLDTFLSELGSQVVQRSSDVERVRLLRAWGIDVLLTHRPLDTAATSPLASSPARLRSRIENFSQPLYVYELAEAPEQLAFVSEVSWAPSVNAAVDRLRSQAFDPLVEVALAGEGETVQRPVGELLQSEVHSFRAHAQVRSEQGGVLVWQRAYLSVYRATVDGEAVPVQHANISRLGVEVPAGEHEVAIWYDRRPFYIALGVSVLGWLLLGVGTRMGRQPAAVSTPR